MAFSISPNAHNLDTHSPDPNLEKNPNSLLVYPLPDVPDIHSYYNKYAPGTLRVQLLSPPQQDCNLTIDIIPQTACTVKPSLSVQFLVRQHVVGCRTHAGHNWTKASGGSAGFSTRGSGIGRQEHRGTTV